MARFFRPLALPCGISSANSPRAWWLEVPKHQLLGISKCYVCGKFRIQLTKTSLAAWWTQPGWLRSGSGMLWLLWPAPQKRCWRVGAREMGETHHFWIIQTFWKLLIAKDLRAAAYRVPMGARFRAGGGCSGHARTLHGTMGLWCQDRAERKMSGWSGRLSLWVQEMGVATPIRPLGVL